MTLLPASVEAYLVESGFSGSEILILKKLLAEDAQTVRQIAAKSGKSTGVLDQAMKKLLAKRIVTKEWINDTYKYSLTSLQAVVDWMEKDMKQRRAVLVRKQQDFESFIETLKVDKERPEMEYFEGREGITKAYRALLETGSEMLHYFPVKYTEQEDPLRDFRVEYFRERRRRGIFARYIVHNTPLGRRFQSRDIFEYRKAILVEREEYPFFFEQIIVGDTFACFDHERERACFIRYPELARTEREFFLALWKRQTEKAPPQEEPAASEGSKPPQEPLPIITVRTRTFSGLRDFFLSRRSIAAFVLCTILAAGVTFGLYKHNAYLNLQRVRERVMSIAATGALQFSHADLDKLHGIDDVARPEYSSIVAQLNHIRDQNEDIVYVYLIRPTEQKNMFEFIADADAVDPFAKVDTNGDGIVDEADTLGVPGLEYDVTGKDVLEEGNYDVPTANYRPYTDKWGSFITGYAPIKDEAGLAQELLAVDVWANEVRDLSNRSFFPILTFIGFFLLFVFVRLAAFNRSLFRELWEAVQVRSLLYVLGFSIILATGVTYGAYLYTLNIMKHKIAERLMSIAATAAPEIDVDDLEPLRLPRDMR